MKRKQIIHGLLALSLAGSLSGTLEVQAQVNELKAELTGSWYNPAQDGHGFNFQALDETTLLAFWYTYDAAGNSTFLVGTLELDEITGEYAGTLQRTDGMVFGDFDPGTVDRTDWGTLSVAFDGCNSGVAAWQSTMAGFPDVTIPIQRLTRTNLFVCIDDPATGNYAITTLEDDGRRVEGNALVLPNGDLYLAAGESEMDYVVAGTLQQTGTLSLRADGTRYTLTGDGSSPQQTSSFRAVATLNRSGFGGMPEIALPTNAFLRGTPLGDFRRHVPVASLAGSYSLIDTVASYPIATVDIATDGAVTGSLINGCSLGGGAITQSLPGTNQFEISILVDDNRSFCADSDLVGAGFSISPLDGVQPVDIYAILVAEAREYASVYRLDR
ncbi:MAG: hypothetical protein V2I57_08950 [Xanthomonadales bacterium]|jgi:hypothetical protein|nr:hypothetical protein [Xanthomonadales bacterium]